VTKKERGIIGQGGGNPGAISEGTQYTEGDIDVSISGTAILWEDASDTLATVSAANPLPVNATLPTSYSDHSAPARGKILGTALTTSYASIISAANANDARIIQVFNTCDETILISLDGGSTDHYELESSEKAVSIDLGASGLQQPNLAIQVKDAGVTPSSGSVRCTVIK
jgi:hypothetical protein